MGMLSYIENMSYDSIQNLQGHHPSWKLLNARRAPMIISFLYHAFVMENQREIPEYIKQVSVCNTAV